MPFFLENLIQAVINGNAVQVREEVKKALAAGVDPARIITDGFVAAMDVVGERFERNEIYVTDLIITARAMHTGLKEIKPFMLAGQVQPVGRAIIGTVQGDIHDIGKNLLGIMLEASGFEVIDLGVNVAPSTFVEAVIKYRPDVLCLSALLSSTRGAMGETIAALQEAGWRGKVKVVVGGTPLNETIAAKMGADGYAPDATAAVQLIKDLIGAGQKRQAVLAPATLDLFFGEGSLEDLQLAFTRMTGLHLVMVDAAGNPLTPLGGFLECSRHCHLLQGNPAKDIDVTTLAGNFKEAFIYRCHAGLVEISYPLAGEDGTVGAVLCGHCLLEGDPAPAQLQAAVPVLSIKDLEAVCGLLSFVSGQIMQLNAVLLVNKELEEQRASFIHFLKRQHQLEQALKDAELKVLQSQVNPHFLFNSLNTIARLALFEGAATTEKMVRALARLMRYSLYQVKETVTLAEEIAAVRDYLYIQETRFPDRVRSQVLVEEAVLDARVPCMVLQPLVENAVIHGLEPREEGGRITVSGRRVGDQVHIEIKDDGIGIPPEVQKAIFDLQVRGGSKGQVSGLGIVNVYRRLQHQFGSNCALDVTSTPGKGTCIQLTFPYTKE
ncbi:Signal transduction histidine kinase, core [Moorella glycerini]|uniref:histidine kinase n=1 Tax=Neomoorella stamsii TaxID=1266720 RepID=A0A9X7J550_9FIRM|nr:MULTISPECIES: histidine kinase [Moorella]PRR74550.1 Sensor histidine kinase YehU [Moorella stamsii]CEP69163.1 Signal transduction histidine kinase, core [Moorella glycerini]